jgi:hypothetical protein
MKLPGLPTFSALMLATVLTAWLGLWGPINFERLQQWQTLLASCIAVMAASIAYAASMAKVRLDQRIHEAGVARQRAAISLRLKFAAEAVYRNVERVHVFNGDVFSDAEIRFVEPKEFEEAWLKLEDLPPKAVVALESVRNYLRVLRDLPPIKPTTVEEYGYELDNNRETARWVLPRLVRDLAVLIKEL